MSEVKRYCIDDFGSGMRELEEGPYVAFEDFDAQRLRADTAEAELALTEKEVEGLQSALGDAEQRIVWMVKLLHEWNAMWNGGGIHNGPLTKLREATRSALANDGSSFDLAPSPSLQLERDMFEEWAAEESEVRGVGETIGLSTDEHHDRYSMIWTQTSWMAWQARAALNPNPEAESHGSTCNQIREENNLPINNPCKACNGGACIDR